MLRYAHAVLVLVLLGQADPNIACADAGEAPESDVSLDQALALLRASPALRQAQASVAVAAAEHAGVNLWPNPSMTVGFAGTAIGDAGQSRQNYIAQFDLPLLILGQQTARRDVADRDTDAASARMRANYALLAAETRRRFATLLAAQERLALLEGFVNDLDRVNTTITRRTENGANSSYDALRIETAEFAIRARLAELRGNVDEAQGLLSEILGVANWQPHAVGDIRARAEIPGELERVVAMARTRPEVEAAEREQAAAESRTTLAYRNARPIPVLSLQGTATQQTGGAAFAALVTIPLPVFDRGQGAGAIAAAQAIEAERRSEAVLASTNAALSHALDVLARRRDAFLEYENGILSRLARLRTMAETSYINGRSSILELLDAFETERDLRLGEIDLLEDLSRAETEVIYAAGLRDTGGAR